jgi:RimJ/RimL family protein N-acetyltransferase
VDSTQSQPELQLRPATPEDRFRVRRWLAAPQVESRWTSAAGAEAELTLAMGSAAALARIIEWTGAPIGYAQAVEIGLWGRDRPEDLAPGTWDIDLFIAEEAHRGRGLEAAVLALLAEEVFTTTLAVACCAVVPVRNEARVRSCERAGFRWQRIWNDALSGASWVMLKERPARPPQHRRSAPPPPAAAKR